MFSVFVQPVFLFSDSRNINYFGPKAHGPENRGEGWDWSPRAKVGPGQGLRGPPPLQLPASSCGLSGWPQPLCWHPLPGVGTAGQGSAGGFLSE